MRERNYHGAAVIRVRELGLRLGFAVMITIAASVASSSLWPLVWLGMAVAIQLVNAGLSIAPARDTAFAPGPMWVICYLAVQFINSAIFAAIAPYLWFACGMEGRLIGLVVLMGGLMMVGTQPDTSGHLFWLGCLPFILVLGSLPLLTAVVEPGVSMVLMSFLVVGSGVYLLHVLRTARRREDAARLTADALNRAQQANDTKSTFLATMSHEIRTPLNGVLGMAQALEADALPHQRKRLEVIRQSGSVLLTLLNDLLDISRIEAAKLELEDGLIDFIAMAAHSEAAFGALTADKDVILTVTADDSVQGVWRGDPTRVRQILHNLLANAVKFTERGAVEVSIHLDAEQRVRLEVRDTGPGLSESEVARLFERFVQGDASTTRRYGGSGLGLAISRELATLMGGELLVESWLGQGSRFTAILPLTQGVETAHTVRIEPPPPQRGSFRVLVAEDNETNQLVISTLLEQIGIEAHLVANGVEALQAFREGSWDLVLMDIQMPLMDGLDTTREIRALESAAGRPPTPIVALTANTMSYHLAEYEAAGMDDVATKPIQLGPLFEAIDRALERAEARASSGVDEGAYAA